jgi:hypothetical protein
LVNIAFVRVFFGLFYETLPIINKSKHSKKGEYKQQNERTHVQKDKKIPKKTNHKKNIKFLDPFLSQEAYQIRKGQTSLKDT